MFELVLSNVVAFAIGLATCFLSWWVLFHVIAPKVEFAPKISRLASPDDGAGLKWRFKFANRSRRGLIDAQVSVRLSIKALQFSDSWAVFRIPLDRNGDLKYEIPLVSPNNNRVIRMFPSASQEMRESALLPEAIRESARRGELRLDDLLQLGEKASVTVYVVGYDAFSGSRRLFKSERYRLDDVVDGTFKGMTVTPREPAATVVQEEDAAGA